jgi:hypothetical protein
LNQRLCYCLENATAWDILLPGQLSHGGYEYHITRVMSHVHA